MDIYDEKKQRNLCRTNASRASPTPKGRVFKIRIFSAYQRCSLSL